MSLTRGEKAKQTKFKNRLLKEIHLVPEYNQEVAKELIDELSFIRITLDKTKEDIAVSGATSRIENGKQVYTSQTASMKVYNTLLGRYSTYLRQLSSLYPKTITDDEPEGDDLEAFLQEGDRIE